MPTTDRVQVFLEGASDVAAVCALAAKAGVDRDRIRLVDLGGVTNVGRALTWLDQEHPDDTVLGLCDAGEADVAVRALRRSGLALRDASDLQGYGFFVCVRDLEDELIRALGTARAVAVVESLGLGGKLEVLRGQQAWRDRPLSEQVHRFCGVASGRKELLAGAFAEALNAEAVPEPLQLLLDRLPRAPG